MHSSKNIGALFCLFIILACGCCVAVRTGLDNIDTYRLLFEGQRIGIITNHTACNREGTHILDLFDAMDNVTVAAIFGPEHGFEGIYQAGEKVENAVAPDKTVPIYSLYGKHRKPSPEMLAGLDLFVFDIQDIGTRYYTYIYTMALAMEAAAENGKKFVVLDRPNPINALHVQGNILEPEFSSFVGLYPIPTRHGMTTGELARLFNGQGWLRSAVKADLTIVPMTGYRRAYWYDQTGLPFINPSPNIVSLDAAAIYPGTCLLEGTNISEGRGTDSPFLVFGAPWIQASELTARLNALQLAGVKFEPAEFIPSSSKYAETPCRGAKIVITDRHSIDPFWTGIHLVNVLFNLYPEQFEWKSGHFDHLCGTDKIRNAIIQGMPLESLKVSFQRDIEGFDKLRQPYLLYPD